MRSRVMTLLLFSVLGACASLPDEPALPVAEAATFSAIAAHNDAGEPVIVHSAVAHTLALVNARLDGHSTLPDHEWVFCLRGEMQGERVIVDDVGVTRVLRLHAQGLTYSPCSGARYVGVWHPHPPGMVPPALASTGGCYFSDPDVRSFLADAPAVVALVSCGGGLLLAMRKASGGPVLAAVEFAR